MLVLFLSLYLAAVFAFAGSLPVSAAIRPYAVPSQDCLNQAWAECADISGAAWRITDTCSPSRTPAHIQETGDWSRIICADSYRNRDDLHAATIAMEAAALELGQAFGFWSFNPEAHHTFTYSPHTSFRASGSRIPGTESSHPTISGICTPGPGSSRLGQAGAEQSVTR